MVNRQRIQNIIKRLSANVSIENLEARLSPKSDGVAPRLRHHKVLEQDTIKKTGKPSKKTPTLIQKIKKL